MPRAIAANWRSEFLTDNTLGRVWYEMRQGKTRLVDECECFVRHPNEVFLNDGKKAPQDQSDADKDLSQEELLRKTVYVPFRTKKDPRDLRILDPACGSGHFLLYAFNLLTTIYEEAWHDEHGPASEATGCTLREDYANLDGLLQAVPGLVLRYNLYGIDIDPRAAQIAALALWMRSQRAFDGFGIAFGKRPTISKTNIVVAEPMPCEKEMREEFVASLDRQLGKLVERVFERMEIAGEAGALLKIEEEIQTAIRDVYGGSGELFRKNDEERWQGAEEQLLSALHTFVTKIGHGSGFQRRLFADDAARGFAFIDVCRRRYDVALMNPPFGEASRRTRDWLAAQYPRTKHDLLASFCERGLGMLLPDGSLGEISSRAAFFLKSFERWRDEIFGSSEVQAVVDLGSGVLDDAMVEAACYVLSKRKAESERETLVIRLVLAEDKGHELLRALADLSDNRRFLVSTRRTRGLPNAPFIYWISRATLDAISSHSPLEPNFALVRQGLGTGDNNRFVRAAWEIPPDRLATASASVDSSGFRDLFNHGKRWAYHVRAGSSQPWYSPLTLVIDWENQGARLKGLWRSKGENPSRYIPSEDLYFQAGFSWTLRAFRFIPYVIPRGCIPSASRYMAFPKPSMEMEVLALCASNLATAFMRFYGEKFEYPKYLVDTVKRLPCVGISRALASELASLVSEEVTRRRNTYRNYEPFCDFTLPALLKQWSSAGGAAWNPKSFLGHEMEVRVSSQFGLSEAQLEELEMDLFEAVEACTRRAAPEKDESEDDDEGGESWDASSRAHHADLVSYYLGCVFGRWDIRYATGEKAAPELPDPFAPLPVCPPGQLQNAEGLPACPDDVPAAYPLRIPWDGIVVDDPNHPLDIERRVREVIEITWGARNAERGDTNECAAATPEQIENEACEVLGVKSLREYFRKPSGFFTDHLKRYSKSRRQAPVYWPLSTGSGSYTLWIYYHRLTKDTFFKALNDYVTPKLREEERKLAALVQSAGGSPTASQRKEATGQEAFVHELRGFREELLRVATLWNPDLNDGVIINSAPLWRMIAHRPWQESAKDCWDHLVGGDYDWAHLAIHLWPERVIPKCVDDCSLAIAHGLEEVLWRQGTDGRQQNRKVDETTVFRLISEKTSPAIKDALKGLFGAATGGIGRGGRKKAVAAGRSTAARLSPETAVSGTTVSTVSDTIDRVREAIAGVTDGVSKAEVVAATGITDGQWKAAIGALLAQGLVTKTNERHRARYHIVEIEGRS